jgi:hypothetical protein
MLANFWTRFTVLVFAGAAIGLLIGLVANAVFDAGWNPFAVMPWTIMAAALYLSFSLVRPGATQKKGDDA